MQSCVNEALEGERTLQLSSLEKKKCIWTMTKKEEKVKIP